MANAKTQDPAGLLIDPLAAVYQGTVASAGKHPVSRAIKIPCRRASDDEDASAAEVSPAKPPKVYVVRKDCLVVAEKLVRAGKSCIVLNFANNKIPGGPGAGQGHTQEAALFRRTNLCLSLDKSLYPIDAAELSDPALLYSSTVTVHLNALHHELKPFQIGVITCAAIAHPATRAREGGGREFSHPRDAAATLTKMHSILETAATAGADAIILGAWGCGAFAGPLEGMVDLWKKALAACKAPPYVAFAIVSHDQSAEAGLVKAFGRLTAG